MNDTLDIDLHVLSCEPAEQYHARAGEYLSSHQLLDFIKCPWLHRKKSIGLIEDKDSPAYLIGRAAHVRILEGRDAYETAFALGGPINPRTQKPFGSNTKAFREWAQDQGRPVLSHDNVELIEQMAGGVAMNDEAVDLLLYGRSEGVVRAEYCGTPCQIRIDWLHPHRGIVELKTCDDLTWFESDARRYGYHRQAAFYQAVLAEVIGETVPVHVVAVEKKEPFRCGVWRVSDETLAAARRENEAAIRRLLTCRRRDHWPTGYEEIRVLDVI
ncbi:MAG: PD-(D/E)XK nuclease-like domain-containing protein [Phycisphaerae bacterium]